jgi:hypothetical protein
VLGHTLSTRETTSLRKRLTRLAEQRADGSNAQRWLASVAALMLQRLTKGRRHLKTLVTVLYGTTLRAAISAAFGLTFEYAHSGRRGISTMATPNLSEIVTTTIESRSASWRITSARTMRCLTGSKRRASVSLSLAVARLSKNSNTARTVPSTGTAAYDPLNISPSEVFSAAQFDWKQASVAVSVSGLEELMNAGDEQIIDLLESRIENAERTMKNQMGAAVYGDGTAAGGKAIGGLALLVPDAPTAGTVGGINRATWTFWQSQEVRFAVADGGGAATTANIISVHEPAVAEACSRYGQAGHCSGGQQLLPSVHGSVAAAAAFQFGRHGAGRL